MKNRLTHQQEIELSKEAKASVYISDYSKAVQITLRDKDKNNETHVIELEIPLDIARGLVCELLEDFANYDQIQEDRKAELEAAKAETV